MRKQPSWPVQRGCTIGPASPQPSANMQHRLQALGRRGRVDLNRQHLNARVRSRVIRPSSEVPDDRRRPGGPVGLSPAPQRTTGSTSNSRTTYLNCPRCGLSIARNSRRRAFTHCLRCARRSRTVVELFRSRLPADLVYADSALPQALAVTAGRRHQRRWQVTRAPTTTPKSLELIRSATLGGHQ
jgi:hypothetical protein